MGAVQRLATVVIIGLVAVATALTVYIANEPDRRGSETTEQDTISIERGTDLYIKYCLQCHGPDGQGRNEGNGRIGPPLNQANVPEDQQIVTFQSDDPSKQNAAEAFIHFRVENGAPADPRFEKVMPAFGPELNVQEINDLVYMIMHVDWNYVYNQAVIQTGESQHAADCVSTPDLENCGEEVDESEITPLYPTVPPTAVPTEAAS